MLKKQQFLIASIVFCLLFQLSAGAVFAREVPVPIVESIEQSGNNTARPLITGLTANHTEVLVYLNGEFISQANINTADTPTDNFYWRPETVLPAGKYQVTLVARDTDSMVLSAMSEAIMFTIDPLAAPTLFTPDEKTVTGMVKPPITGLSVSGTLVHVFIDGQVNGNTGLINDPSGTANFSYRPFLNLEIGEHTAWAIAEDAAGRRSGISNILHFHIESPMPAPIMFGPVVNNQTTATRPFITGLTKNNSLVRVFIDGRLNGEFMPESDSSGTANFAYLPFLDLTNGPHMVYATAIDDRGKESAWSNIIYFSVTAPQISSQAATAAAEPIAVQGESGIFSSELGNLLLLARLYQANNSVVIQRSQLDALGNLLANKDSLAVSADELALLENLYYGNQGKTVADNGAAESASTTSPTIPSNNSLSELIGSTSGQNQETGMIDESQEKQSKLKLNLAIFILFLLAVIAWIFWVNRELIKERKEQSDKESEKDGNRKD